MVDNTGRHLEPAGFALHQCCKHCFTAARRLVIFAFILHHLCLRSAPGSAQSNPMAEGEELAGHQPCGTVASAVGVVKASGSQGGERTQSPTVGARFDSSH